MDILLLKLFSHKDKLIYGGAYMFWGIFAYVEVHAYIYSMQLAITLFLMTSLFTILYTGS